MKKRFIVIVKGNTISLLIGEKKYFANRTKEEIEKLDAIIKNYFSKN